MFEKKHLILNICLSQSEGGLELSVVKFSQIFLQEGADCILICRSGSLIEKKAKELGLQTVSFNATKWILHDFLRIKKVIQKFQPDTIVCHRSRGMKLAAIQKLFQPKIKIVAIIHTLMNVSKKDFIHRYLYKKIDKVIVLTDQHKKNALHFLPLETNQIEVISHIVDANRFHLGSKSAARKFLNLPNEQFILGCVGRFDLQKGQLELIESLKILKEMNLNFKAVFVGQDTYEEPGTLLMAKKKVMEYGLQSHVQFFSHTTNPDLFFQSFDLFIMPSHCETYGLVLLEAMLCGTLCLATNAGGPVEILDAGNAGLLVEPKSPIEMANAIAKVIRSPQDFEEIRVRGILKAQVLSDEKVFRKKIDKAIDS